MKEELLLKEFQYTIPASLLAFKGVKNNYLVAEHLPLMQVTVNFEEGELKLEGDWRFMMAANRHNEPGWLIYHRERVEIETAIYSSLVIDLNDRYTDGLVFPLEGSIQDGDSLHSCSGLLVTDNVRGSDGLIGNQWNISFYLYDAQFDDCKIKFKLSIYQTSLNENNN
jgi:hypothetical protein